LRNKKLKWKHNTASVPFLFGSALAPVLDALRAAYPDFARHFAHALDRVADA
jgi:hypothetical protein